MAVEKVDYKLKDINEGISQNIVNNDVDIDEAYATKNYDVAFAKAQMTYSKISMYDIQNKETILIYEETLENYFLQLGGKPANEHEAIKIGKIQMELKTLIKDYIMHIRLACYSLGLWLRVFKQNADIDRKISEETFDTEISLIKDKKIELEKISSKQLMKLMNNNHIHNAYSRHIINKAISREKKK